MTKKEYEEWWADVNGITVEWLQVVGMTKKEYEEWWADVNGITVKWMHRNGQYAVPCACGESWCLGWTIKGDMSYEAVAGQE